MNDIILIVSGAACVTAGYLMRLLSESRRLSAIESAFNQLSQSVDSRIIELGRSIGFGAGKRQLSDEERFVFDRLQPLRVRSGMSHKLLRQQSGVSEEHIHAAEKGEPIPAESIAKLKEWIKRKESK